MPLADITAGIVDAPRDVRVADVTLDSRAVRAGALFLACRGATHHGLEFAEQALSQGARAMLYEPDADAAGSEADALPPSVRAAVASGRLFVAPVPRLSSEAGVIADRFFRMPSQHLAVAGVTGTSGKTTCAYLAAQALTRLGRQTGYVGTLGWGLPGAITPLDLTTPDAVTVQRQLAALRALGAECVAMEVSSHALEQGRINGVRFRAAAFTNLSRDHLDFHGSMADYGAAKARLFDRDLAARIVNGDDAFGRELARRFASAPERLILTSRTPVASPSDGAREWRGESVRARDVQLEPAGMRLAIESSWGAADVRVPLIGDFNVENVLTVLGLLLSLDAPLERAAAVLQECAAPPGRMEIVRGRADDAVAIVDYAHKPDALAKALRAARAHCAGTLRVVFGCGGDRDRGKRALMGSIARELADEVTVTDDNPRTEDPQRIIADILAGITPQGGAASVVHDRAAAIRGTLARASAGDVVLIAGKGHEEYQIVGRERRPFSDRAVAEAFFAGARERA